MRSMKTAAPSAPAKETKFDPSTWANQARLLAKNQAEAAALRMAMVLSALVLLALAARLLVDLPLPQDPAAVVAIALACVAIVAGVWLWTYASALAANTRQVRRATWQEELDSGQDLDDDGLIGPPAQQPAGHVVKIGGAKPRDVVLPDLDPAPWAARPLARFPVPANDVIYILNRAAKSGLGFRDWDGHRLPSGTPVDRPLWTRIIDGMVDWEMVQATTDAGGRRRVRLAGDVTVDEMIAAVRQSTAGRQPA